MTHFRSIDGLRAWLAWIVVFAHIALNTAADVRLPVLEHTLDVAASRSVSVFIIISGFVITHLLLERQESYIPYITRRFLRIYPLYLICLCAGVFATRLHLAAFAGHPWGVYVPQPDLIAAETHSLAGSGFLWNLAAHLTLLHGAIPNNVLPVSEYTFLGPAWSLSLEWQFYLAAPFIVKGILDRSTRTAVTLAALGTYLAFRFGVFGDFFDPSFLPGATLQFATGIATRMLYYRLPTFRVYPIAGMLLALGFIALSHDLLPFICWFAFVAWMRTERPAGTPAARTDGFAAMAFSSRWAVLLGKRSYSTYLVHEPIINGLVYVCITWFAMPMWQTVICTLLAVPVLTMAASAVLFKYVETPAIEYGRGLFSSQLPAEVSA